MRLLNLFHVQFALFALFLPAAGSATKAPEQLFANAVHQLPIDPPNDTTHGLRVTLNPSTSHTI
jgi:hypothetical protein